MSTLTNRSTTSKHYKRSRENLSRQLRTIHLGPMTQVDFQHYIGTAALLFDRITFYRNTAVISNSNGNMKRFSYTPSKV